MPHPLTCAFVFAVLTGSTPPNVDPDRGGVALPMKLPGKDQSPIFRDGLPRTGDATPAPRKRLFGLGVGFQSKGNAQGIALEQIVAGSPADRAGFAAGMVIAEINGESTVGRTGEECRHMVLEAGNSVTVKYYDPATLKLRTRTVEKEWLVVPGAPN